MKNFIGSLLHLSDPTLPIGGYTHSNGLETYVQQGLVKDRESAMLFVHNMLTNNLLYNDAAFVKLAYEAAQSKNTSALFLLDDECAALKTAREIRQASQKLGVRLIKIFKRQVADEIINEYEKAIFEKKSEGHYCIVFGIYASLLNIPLYEALFAFLYNAAVGMVTNAVKLVPLGQLDGQDILHDMQEVIETVAGKTIELDRNHVGLCNIGLDVRCMQHEQLYSRLYMS
ncbi:urease accessory protein UreF [Flavobacterium johnsoniae]|uniref:Urease accessory protein UreF n=1 Tax=Flavobacterium johnsoniae (strain ATCC 17061 / DSM 2064 / JCM 8514 / BCRC 14874 / CCUG 350202 / NBRC 14942 / NCIMB 11054 / UW101) TaxID=376686 RepID=A5FAC9_FLAJ1|nr:Urease accessory protein UreF [Flavobacterium johnsoniae UW101]SHL00496.1 urease accessory protein [Flavobacterium johnsoniae]